jgi:hypothetical protein
MRPPDQAQWNPLPGDVASNGKAERTVVDRWIQSVTYRCPTTGRLATCSLRTWIDWAEEVVHVEQ